MKHDDPRIKHDLARMKHENGANETRRLHRRWKTFVVGRARMKHDASVGRGANETRRKIEKSQQICVFWVHGQTGKRE